MAQVLDGTADSRHAREKYQPHAERKGKALCLSGGGFRAALFHLGALKRLNELGILSQIDAISSVSGGSILAAHLATTVSSWPAAGQPIPDWEDRVAAPFRGFAAKNLRTAPILKRLLPWNWFRESTGVEALAQAYEMRLTGLRLKDLPQRPHFILCATDMAFGAAWTFEREWMGDYQVGHLAVTPDWPLARAVAASSCFPPVFNPLPMRISAGDIQRSGKASPAMLQECLKDLRLTDGGNYDNMGLEPVWKSAELVLVSNGGATFDFGADRNLIWRLSRYQAIQARQAEAVRTRWLISSFLEDVLQGAYWSIGSDVTRYHAAIPGYSPALVDEIISEVRTDMDAFSQAEIKVLENHGYLLADAAVARHLPALSSLTAPRAAPHPEYMDEARVRVEMQDSHKRKLPFGRYQRATLAPVK